MQPTHAAQVRKTERRFHFCLTLQVFAGHPSQGHRHADLGGTTSASAVAREFGAFWIDVVPSINNKVVLRPPFVTSLWPMEKLYSGGGFRRIADGTESYNIQPRFFDHCDEGTRFVMPTSQMRPGVLPVGAILSSGERTGNQTSPLRPTVT